MKCSNHSGFRDHPAEYGVPGWLRMSHRLVCTLCGLVAVFCLLGCIVSLNFALADAHKFKGLGFNHPFHYYLIDNQFPEDVVMCLLVFAEFLHYIRQYRKAVEFMPVRGMIWCFIGMLVLHGIIWWHANFIVDRSASTWAHYYCNYANISLLPSVAYCIVYSLCIRGC